MYNQIKLIYLIIKSQVDYIILFSTITLALILIHQFVPSDGFAQTFLIIAFVYLITIYYGYLITTDQRKIGEFIFTLPSSTNVIITTDLIIILLSNLCAYILWSAFLVGTDRIFMMLPLMYMISISIFTSILIMIQKYKNTRFNQKISLIIFMGTFIFFLFGYMPIQNLYDRGMIDTTLFYFTWLPVIVLVSVLIFSICSKVYIEKHAHSKHLLWSD
ncbi:hypothetical protein [Macrococcus animalis]|uniref:hypothetical protein n=1 Tax=Macrococcus animalis TaxID=3395467 RepID=UPI0039BF8F69